MGDALVSPLAVYVSFPPEGDTLIDGEMLILNLDMEGVLVSAGSACASGALEPIHCLCNDSVFARSAHDGEGDRLCPC